MYEYFDACILFGTRNFIIIAFNKNVPSLNLYRSCSEKEDASYYDKRGCLEEHRGKLKWRFFILQ